MKRTMNTALLIVGLVASGASQRAKAAERIAEDCLPADTMICASIDVGGLRKAVPQTPLGRIFSHPGTQKALGDLPAMLRQQVERFAVEIEDFVGGDIFKFLDAISGRWTIAVEFDAAPGKPPIPSAYAMLDLRSHGQLLGQLADMYVQLGAQAMELELSERKVGETTVKFAAIPNAGHALHVSSASGFLIIGFCSPESYDALLARASGQDAETALSRSETYVESTKEGLADPLVSVYLNAEPLRAMGRLLLDSSEPNSDQIIAKIYSGLGLDKLASVRFELALTDGDWESRLAARSPGGFGGLASVLVDSFGAGEVAALERVPSGVDHLASYSIDKGRFFRELEKVVESAPKELPIAPLFGMLVGHLEKSTGLSVKDDLQTLPKLNVTAFRIDPPSGGLVPDTYAVCRTGEIVPYLVALDKMAKTTGASVRPAEIQGKPTVHVQAKSLLRMLGIGPATGPFAQLPDEAKLAMVALDPGLSIAFTPLDDEWILVADSPQALERYLLVHGKSPSIAAAPRWKDLLATVKSESAAFLLLGGGESFLTGYNTVVSILDLFGPTAEPALRRLNVDLAKLPPGEEFLPHFKPGYVYVERDAHSIEVRGHRVLTNTLPSAIPELLTVLARFWIAEF